MTDTTKPTPGYTAASNGRRLLSFRPPNMGPNSVTQYGLATIVGRSRSGVRNDPWVGTAGDKLVSNMVGTGIQSKMVNGTPELKAADKALWKRFMKECDADGVLDAYGLQVLTGRGLFDGGEVFLRRRPRSAQIVRHAHLVPAERTQPHGVGQHRQAAGAGHAQHLVSDLN